MVQEIIVRQGVLELGPLALLQPPPGLHGQKDWQQTLLCDGFDVPPAKAGAEGRPWGREHLSSSPLTLSSLILFCLARCSSSSAPRELAGGRAGRWVGATM